jgi:hypothetical protein
MPAENLRNILEHLLILKYITSISIVICQHKTDSLWPRDVVLYWLVVRMHLVTGNEGNDTFIVPKVPMPRTIVGAEGLIKVLLPEYQVYKCFIILNNCASCRPFSGGVLIYFISAF